MRIKFVGKWYEIDSITTNLCDNIADEFEEGIDDIEINGRHLTASVDSDVISAYPKGRVTDGKYDVMNVGKEDNFPTKKDGLKVTAEDVKEAKIKKKGCWEVGDEVVTIDQNGEEFSGKITEIYNNSTCWIENGDNNLGGVPLSNLVANDEGADIRLISMCVASLQAEYWKKRALHEIDWYGTDWDEESEQPNNASNAIDWEQRTYDVAAQLYVRQLSLSEQECVDAAKKLIDTYRKQSEL